ncbi:hypothetical protein SAMN05421858_3812 [Haladaptatus litoreus]|uniref:DUF7979 domain-containing protein n=1 Tax=Haladaptatus litoreus TaxID=553468 RepID=A0A1N7DWP5_9EURY|nr:hypothetical protein [Haladaptatus litoreus]SIR80262.1 hypothetical protein SAMN05421858_3812 [Haladaptatus litoreus]
MRSDGLVIQLLATLLLVAGLVLTGYALLQPPQSATTYTLTVEQVNENEPGVRSSSVQYGDLSDEARLAFGRAKFQESYEMEEEPPDQLRNSFVIDGDLVYRIDISEREHITERMATLFGGTTTALIGAFVFVSWLDVVSGFRSGSN